MIERLNKNNTFFTTESLFAIPVTSKRANRYKSFTQR